VVGVGTALVTGMNAQTLVGEFAKEASSVTIKVAGQRVDPETVGGDRSLGGDEGKESPVSASIPSSMPTGGGEAVGDMRSSKVDIYQNMAQNASKPTSELFTFSMRGGSSGDEIAVNNLPEPFSFSMKNKRVNGTIFVSACKFWNKNDSDWDGDGCVAVRIIGNYTQCNCSHLTDFSNSKPKYNAVDPVGDASSLLSMGWSNMTTVATIGAFFIVYALCILSSIWKEQRDLARMKILSSFGAKAKDGKTPPPETKLQAAWQELQTGFTQQHQWFTAVFAKTGESYSRNMKITVVFCIIFASLCVNALFFGQGGETDVMQTLFVATMSGLIVAPPTIIFMIAFKKAGDFNKRYQQERDTAGAPQWMSDVNSQPTGAVKQVGGDEMSDLSAEAAQVGTLASMSASVGRATQGDLSNMGEDNPTITNQPRFERTLGKHTAFEYPYVVTVYSGAIVFMLFCSYIMVLFGLGFKGSQAEGWLASSIFTMGQDLLVMEPMKIVGKALFGFLLFASTAAASGGLSDMLGFDEE